MNYTGPVYRPPYEANTLLLEVTVGCAHNKCTFCTMYREVKFSIAKEDQIRTIELIDVETYYMGIHIINTVSFDAELPRDRQRSIDRINYAMENMTDLELDRVPERHSI